jgi:hypothetical protein
VVRFKYGIVTLAIVGGLVALIVSAILARSRLSVSWTYDMYIGDHLDEQVAWGMDDRKDQWVRRRKFDTVPHASCVVLQGWGPDRLDLE